MAYNSSLSIAIMTRIVTHSFLSGFRTAWRPFPVAFQTLFRAAILSSILFLLGAALLAPAKLIAEACFLLGGLVLLIGSIRSWLVILNAER